MYFSGDGAFRDGDGHYQITGRVDDVINSRGHRLGTAEVESAMVRKPSRMVCMCMHVRVCVCLYVSICVYMCVPVCAVCNALLKHL